MALLHTRGPRHWLARRALPVAVLLALSMLWLQPAVAAAAAVPADYSIAGGHFYSQANGQGGGPGQPGFAIVDDASAPMWSYFSQNGAVSTFGFPISIRFQSGPFVYQAMQRDVLQWDGASMSLVNVLDTLHNDNLDGWLQSQYMTPPPVDTSADSGLTFSQVEQRHQAFLATDPVLQAAYFAAADPVSMYGLPMSLPQPEANGAVIVVRLQRAVLQHWLTAQPWAAANQVTVANAGDIAKAAGILPPLALNPIAAPPEVDAQQASTGPSILPLASADSTSANWSGYFSATSNKSGQPGSVTFVSGQWAVPAVDCTSTPNAAVGVWVGIDGVFSPTVEQTGTASICQGGQASYSAWFEIFPAGSRTPELTIRPGDTIVAQVRYLGGFLYRLSLSDLTTGQGFAVDRPSPGSRDSAEWIVESPSSQKQLAPLAKFTVITIGNAIVTLNGVTGGVSNAAWSDTSLEMVDSAGNARARPSVLSADGKRFQVTWEHS